jgi:hypothetical protein
VEVKAHEDALDAVICAWVGVCALEDLARRRLEMRTRRSGFQVRKDNDLLSAVARVHHCRRSELSIPSGTSGRCTLSFSPIVNSWIKGDGATHSDSATTRQSDHDATDCYPIKCSIRRRR